MNDWNVLLVRPDSDREAVLAAWEQGETLHFTNGVEVDQSWIDDLSPNGLLERASFACTFVGAVSFAELTFIDKEVLFSFSTFTDAAVFDRAEFNGPGKADFSACAFEGSASFMRTRLGERTLIVNSAVFKRSCRFDGASLGARAYLNASYYSDVSFRGAHLATGETALGNARFKAGLDLSEISSAPGSLLTFRGISVASPASVRVVDVALEGEVLVVGEAPEAIAALRSASTPGQLNPLTGWLSVTFTQGRLAGHCYEMAGTVSVLNLLAKIEGDSTVVVSRPDVDFTVHVVSSGDAIAVSLPNGSQTEQFDADAKWPGLEDIILRLQVLT